MFSSRVRSTLLLAGAAFTAFAAQASAQQAVNLYTTREPGLVRPLIEAFEKKTGVKVNTMGPQGHDAQQADARIGHNVWW